MKSNTLHTRSLKTLLITFAALSVSACGGSSAKSEFIKSCKAGGASSKICKCAYGRIKSKYSEKELQRLLNTPLGAAIIDKQTQQQVEAFTIDTINAAVICSR